MSSPASTVTLSAPGTSPDASLRRSGWLFVGSLILFLVGLVAMSVNVDRFNAEQAAADDLGVTIHDVPARVLAAIAQEHSSLSLEIATSLPAVLGFVLLVMGVWTATPRAKALGRAARLGAVVSMLGFTASQSVFLALYADPADVSWVLDRFSALVSTATAASVMAGCASVLIVVLLLRARGAARRTGAAVGAIAAISVLAAPLPAVGGMPPLLPCLLAAILGVPMIRTARSSARHA